MTVKYILVASATRILKYINDFSKINDGNEEDAEQEIEWERNVVNHVKGLDRT